MADDTTFRVVMAAGLAVFFPVVAYYRLRARAASVEPDRLDRRQEGLFMLVTLRPVGIGFCAVLALYLVNPALMAWASVGLPHWLRWLGAGLYAASAALLLWTLRALGPNLTDTVVTRRMHTMVASGPYRFVRHPLYDSFALWLLANALLAANALLLASGAAVVALLAARTHVEEQNLVARFGEAYRSYMSRTGRFLPKPGSGPAGGGR